MLKEKSMCFADMQEAFDRVSRKVSKCVMEKKRILEVWL